MTLPKIRSPIVLVHGLLGFDQLRLAGLKVADYFPGVSSPLTKAGNLVLIPWLSPTRGVTERAAELKSFLNRHSASEPVHIIAHSMGGLDARYMISNLDMSNRVLSLTTLGTPHRGSSFADWSVGKLERMVRPFLDFVGIPYQAFYDLTTDNCRRFNQLVLDQAKVRYFSVVGDFNGMLSRPEWLLSYSIVYQSEGPNDGVVSVKSGSYGELIATMPCDHLSLVNWTNFLLPPGSTGEDGPGVFKEILVRLADEGF